MTSFGYICTCFNHKDYKEVGVFFNASRMLVLKCLGRVFEVFSRSRTGQRGNLSDSSTFYLEYSFNQPLKRIHLNQF